MDVMEVKPHDLHSIVLSHGHVDHTQGLMGMIKRVGKQLMPVLLHPDAFLNRKVIFPDKSELTRLLQTDACWSRKMSSLSKSVVLPIWSNGWCW